MEEKDKERIEDKAEVFFNELQRDKEEKLVTLLVEYIVQKTLNDYEKEGNEIHEVQ